MKIKCKRCDHEWNYTGKKLKLFDKPGIDTIYVQCPMCKTTVSVSRLVDNPNDDLDSWPEPGLPLSASQERLMERINKKLDAKEAAAKAADDQDDDEW